MKRWSEAAVAASLSLSVTAYPSYYTCDFSCMSGHAPGDAFGMMDGIPNYGPAPTADNCMIVADNVPAGGYIDGEEYAITITSTTALTRKVACNEHASFASPLAGAGVDGAGQVLTETYTWTAPGTGDVVFHALCGAGGQTDQMWVADALTVSRDASQGPPPAAPTPAPAAAPGPAESAAEPSGAEVDLTGDGLGTSSWTLGEENIDVTVIFSRSTWVAFGFSDGDALSMEGGGAGSDVVVCHSDPPVVKRYWITSKSQPSGGVDVVGATCTREGGTTTLNFQRPLAASESQRAVTPGSLQPIIYAYGEGDSYSLQYHASNRGGSSIDFASGAVAEAEKKSAEAALFCHMICMIVCWGGMLPWGVAIASRTRKVTGAPTGAWFKRHRMLQSIGLVGMLCGFAFAIGHVQSIGGVHFNGPHTFIGVFVVVLGALQPLNAFFRPHPTKEGEKKTVGRLVFEIWHKGGGRLACFLGILNIFSGIMVLVRNDYDTVAIATAVTLSILCIGPVIEFAVLATFRPDNMISKACVGASKISLRVAAQVNVVAPQSVGSDVGTE